MKICKYCKKPISDNDVWNPDSEGNGYHNDCLCEMEFRLRDRQIYDKGRADVLDKIRAEIKGLQTYFHKMLILDEVMQILDKYNAETEDI